MSGVGLQGAAGLQHIPPWLRPKDSHPSVSHYGSGWGGRENEGILKPRAIAKYFLQELSRPTALNLPDGATFNTVPYVVVTLNQKIIIFLATS